MVPEPLLSNSENACLHNSSSTTLSIMMPFCGLVPLFTFIADLLNKLNLLAMNKLSGISRFQNFDENIEQKLTPIKCNVF